MKNSQAKRERVERGVQVSEIIKNISALVQTDFVQDQTMSLSKKHPNPLRISERQVEK